MTGDTDGRDGQVSPRRAATAALGVGAAVALGLFGGVGTGPYVAFATATIYAGAAYFYVTFDLSLGATPLEFERRADRLGYAVGLFGTSVSPLVLAQRYGGESVVFVAWTLGLIAFLVFVPRAHRVSTRD